MIVLWEELTPGFCFGVEVGAEKTEAEEEEERFEEDDEERQESRDDFLNLYLRQTRLLS